MHWICKFALSVLLSSCLCLAQQNPPDPRDNSTPYWDGSRIYFKSARDGGGVYLVKTNGSKVTYLTDSDVKLLIKSAGDNYPPRWTHDGKRGVFMTSRDGDFEIYSTDGRNRNASLSTKATTGTRAGRPTATASCSCRAKTATGRSIEWIRMVPIRFV